MRIRRSKRMPEGIREAIKGVHTLRPKPAPTLPPSVPFRPMTPDAYKVHIPRIGKVRDYRRNPIPHVKMELSLPGVDKEEVRKVAGELGVSMNTVIRLAIKRFIRAPELPLTPKQLRIWQMGIRRDKKLWTAKAKNQMRDDLLAEIEKKDRLGTTHLEHKAIEAFANTGYHKIKTQAFRPGLRKGKEGNPHGVNGRDRGATDRDVLDSDRGAEHSGTDRARPETARPPQRRLMVRPK